MDLLARSAQSYVSFEEITQRHDKMDSFGLEPLPPRAGEFNRDAFFDPSRAHRGVNRRALHSVCVKTLYA